MPKTLLGIALGRVGKVERTPHHTMVAAISPMALSWAARFSSRVAQRRQGLQRLIRRSLRLRRRESARLPGPVRPAFRLRGLVLRRPCWRAYRRSRPRLSPGSSIMRCGRRWGRPGPRRLTAPGSRSGAKTGATWRGPGVRRTLIRWPPPSARRWTVGLNPPRLRPRAADSGALVWPQSRAAGLGSSSPRDHGRPSAAGQRPRLARAPPRSAGSPCPPAAHGKRDGPRCALAHRVRADRARGRRCVEAIKCRSGGGDAPPMAGRSWVFGAGAAGGTAPIACW